MNRAIPITFVAVASTLLSWSVGGCGGGAKEANVKSASNDAFPLAIDHEPCDVTSSSAEKLDTNGDGKPDIARVMSGGREICRMVDLNHDDRPDSFLYFDANGAIRRRESDFDRDGRIDEIAYFSAGVIVRKDRETNLDGKFDTWDFYEGGKIHHRMRDSDGDGHVDQWWTWANPDKIECAVIASDHNDDGKPDPNDIIDVCAAAATPAAASSLPVTADAGSAALPGTPMAGSSDGGAALVAATAVPAASAIAPAALVAPSTKKTGTTVKKEAPMKETK